MISKTIAATALMLFAALAVALQPAAAQTDIENAPDPYVHPGNGVAFPAMIGTIQRDRIVAYDGEQQDVSVGYWIDGVVGEMTVYLYPIRGYSCAEEFEGARDAVLQRGATEDASGSSLSLSQFPSGVQKFARFAVAENGFGFEHPELDSYLLVVCPVAGDWIIKYRGSFSPQETPNVSTYTKALFDGIDWSALLAQ